LPALLACLELVQIRYQIEDRWPEGSEPLKLPPEEDVLHAALEDIMQCVFLMCGC